MVRHLDDTFGTFRSLFCQRFHIADADFETHALRCFLHSPWSKCALVLMRLRPSLFAIDRHIIQRLGHATNPDTFFNDVKAIHYHYVRDGDFGARRRLLRMRLSARRISRLASDLFNTR